MSVLSESFVINIDVICKTTMNVVQLTHKLKFSLSGRMGKTPQAVVQNA